MCPSNVTQTEQVGFMRLGIYMFITTIKIKEIGKMAQQVKALASEQHPELSSHKCHHTQNGEADTAADIS